MYLMALNLALFLTLGSQKRSNNGSKNGSHTRSKSGSYKLDIYIQVHTTAIGIYCHPAQRHTQNLETERGTWSLAPVYLQSTHHDHRKLACPTLPPSKSLGSTSHWWKINSIHDAKSVAGCKKVSEM